MSRLAASPALLAAFLVIAGCGGSSHSSSATSRPSSSTAPASTTATSTTASGTASTGQSTSTSTSTSTSASASGGAPPSGGSTSASGGAAPSGSTSTPSTDARVPASFRVVSGGQLSPRLVTAPAFLAVQLTVTSGDGKSHQVVLETPTPHSLSVPANGKASVLVPGLRAGQYRLKVDGMTRGGLVIGGEPGP